MSQYLLGIAQQAPAAAPAASGPAGMMGGLSGLFPFILIFGVFYFLVIRPQSKKAKDHTKWLSELKKGDDVVTQGGILGRITGLKDDEIVLQVQDGVRFRVLRSHVSGRQKSAEPPKAEEKAS